MLSSIYLTVLCEKMSKMTSLNKNKVVGLKGIDQKLYD